MNHIYKMAQPSDLSGEFDVIINTVLTILGRISSITISNQKLRSNEYYDKIASFDVEYRESSLQQDLYAIRIRNCTSIPPPPEFKKLWCTFEVMITNNPYHEIDLHFEQGDKLTFRMICWDLQRELESELLYQTRNNYLRLIGGCTEATEHIPAYLFNDLVSREVCEFIGVRKIEMTCNTSHRHITLRVDL